MAISFTTQPAVGDKATAAAQDNLCSNEMLNDSGSSTITPSDANVTTSLAMTFNKTFPSAPRVICQFTTGISSTATCFVWPTSVTTTGFTLNINRSTTTATSVTWLAFTTQ